MADDHTTSPVSDAMIEAGILAQETIIHAMHDRELADIPENFPDYDEGDVVKAIYLAMKAKEEAADFPSDATKRMAKTMGCEFVPDQSPADEVETIAGAIFDPGRIVGIRGANEALHRWQTRAVIAALSAIRNGDEGMQEALDAFDIDPEDMKIIGDWLEGERGPAPGGRVKGLWQSVRRGLQAREALLK